MTGRESIASFALPIRPMEGGAGEYRVTVPDISTGDHSVVFLFDAPEYPFEQHCRYVRHRDANLPYTFANMEFAESPPGLRAGPWPGWRGIPDFPKIVITLGTASHRVELQAWGDEFAQRQIRGVANVALEPGQAWRLSVGDSRLIPVQAKGFPSCNVSATPVHVELRPELLHTHPRLLITLTTVPDLRTRALGTQSRRWANVVDLLLNWHLPFAKTPESKTVPGAERLSGEDRVLISALIGIVDPTKENISRARETFFQYVAETQQPGFEPLNIDTQCGESLFILCCGYDWLYDHLSREERGDAERWLWLVADRCWSHLGYERHDYAQAHYLGCGLGLLAFSFLFWEEHPRAGEWASHCGGVLRIVRSVLPDDGFYPHGINLWMYEYGFLLRWLELMQQCAGLDFWGSAEHWKNASRFRGAATTPDRLYGETFGDPQFRTGGDSWCHTLIARRTGDAHAQHLGDLLSDAPHEGVDFRSMCARRRAYEFLFSDDRVSPIPATSRTQFFPDGGQVFIRSGSDTSGLFTFRSGPPLGGTRYTRGIRGAYGHSDPSNGSFLLYTSGGFVVSGPGPTYRRDTALHNTLTIDGGGQIGDTSVWLPDFFPPECIVPPAAIRTDGERVLIAADLTHAYLPRLGVLSCRRSMLVHADLSILCVDTVECSTSRQVEWNLHSWFPFHQDASRSRAQYAFGDRGKEWEVGFLSPDSVKATTGLTEMIPAYPHDGKRTFQLRVSTAGAHVQLVWWIGPCTCAFPTVTSDNGAIVVVRLAGDVHVRFDGSWLIPDGFTDET
jgi:hypothetical protein